MFLYLIMTLILGDKLGSNVVRTHITDFHDALLSDMNVEI
jgi:hypothetical protein